MTEASTPIRLLLVDDQALVRRGLRRLLEIEDGIEVVGEAADGHEALVVIAGSSPPPDVALVDARMPGMNGLELIGRLRADHPSVATLLLTTFDDDELIFGSLTAGAGGFLLKGAEPEELLQAIRSVHSRSMVVDGAVAARVVARLTGPAGRDDRTPASPGDRPEPTLRVDPTDPDPQPSDLAPLPPVLPGSPPLTERESEVARLVATGASNREIAATLFLNEGTVKNHVSAALRKLGLRDRTQLAVAIRDAGRG